MPEGNVWRIDSDGWSPSVGKIDPQNNKVVVRPFSDKWEPFVGAGPRAAQRMMIDIAARAREITNPAAPVANAGAIPMEKPKDAKIEQARAEQAKAEQAKAEPAKPAPAAADAASLPQIASNKSTAPAANPPMRPPRSPTGQQTVRGRADLRPSTASRLPHFAGPGHFCWPNIDFALNRPFRAGSLRSA